MRCHFVAKSRSLQSIDQHQKVASGTAEGLAIPTELCGPVSMRKREAKANEHLLQSEGQV